MSMQDDIKPDDAGQVEGADPQPAVESPREPEAPQSRKAVWLAMGAVALALGLIWVAPGIEPHVDEGAPGSTAADYPGEPEDAAAAGKPARLDFTLKDMHGVDVHLESFKGKVILVNFWATWCGPCRAEIPALVELQDQYKDDLVILGLSVDDTAEKLLPYAAEFKMNYPVLVGNGREDVQEAFGPLFGIPVSVIIGRDGVVAKKHSGIATKEQIEREIKTLL
jgi:thiol-disulfide isomerase/thioredoxin